MNEAASEISIEKLKHYKWVILIIIIILVGLFLFWWFEYRPSQIRKNCNMEAIQVSPLPASAFSGTGIRVTVPQAEYEDRYNRCLRKNGL